MTTTDVGSGQSAGMPSSSGPQRGTGGRLRRAATRLTRREWGSLIGMGLFILGLHLVGWGVLVLIVAPQHHDLGTKTFGVGIGLTAYTLGMRHAFDADHIAAIDNTTRSLQSNRSRPLSVGFWFSLGHSTVVFGLAVLLSLGIRAIVGPVEDDDSTLHHYTGLIGTSVSGFFLLLIGIVNLVLLAGIWKIFQDMRTGELDEAELEAKLANRGLANRFFGKMTRSITKPWQIYPVGVLFGLGFDTATEIALLVLAGTSAAIGLPWYAILCLPVLFAAGMSLLDTIDGAFMSFAYEWAFSRPVRKVFYNLTVTGLSVMVALVIGVFQVLSIVSSELDLSGGVWTWLASVDLNTVGFFVAGIFVLTWLAALAMWRFGRIEQRWEAAGAHASVTEDSVSRP